MIKSRQMIMSRNLILYNNAYLTKIINSIKNVLLFKSSYSLECLSFIIDRLRSVVPEVTIKGRDK